jgi:hypothetical protein
MQLVINQTPVEMTLENERTVRDLLDSLERWALQQGQVVVGALIDGRVASEDSASILLEGIGLVELETVGRDNQLEARLGIVGEYLSLASRAVLGANIPLLKDLRSEFGPIRETLDGLGLWNAAERSELEKPWDTGIAKNLLLRLSSRVLERQEMLLDPGRPLARTLTVLAQQLEGVGNLPLLWQKGQDKLAVEKVLALFSVLEDLDRIAPVALQAGRKPFSWSEFRNSIQPFLSEVRQALETQDYVLVTDLIEYELAPRLLTCHQELSAHFSLDQPLGLP